MSGRAYHKKKNHLSKFKRTYNNIRYSEIGAGNIEDAVIIEDNWYKEHIKDEDASINMEYSAIKEALLHFDDLALTGGILYVNDVPAAMTIASYIMMIQLIYISKNVLANMLLLEVMQP